MNNKRFNVGDIVRLKLLGDAHYYMVTDFIDFLAANEKDIDVDYEIVLIYPILKNPKIENMIHEELVKVADFKSKDYRILMDYIIRERIARGFKDIPDNIEHVILDDVKKPRLVGEKKNELMSTNKSSRPVKAKMKPKKFGIKEINAILNDTKTDNRIEELKIEMDNVLDSLNESIKNKDDENIKLHKEKLENIRRELMELEHFTL